MKALRLHLRIAATPHKPRRSPSCGFTLIEVLLVATLIAVLTSIALPHYSEYLRRGHRVHAQATLLQAAQWMERVATAQGAYPERQAIPKGVLAVEGERYVVEFTSLSAGAFALRATPVGAQGVDPCGAFELDATGIRTQGPTAQVPAPLPPHTCWTR